MIGTRILVGDARSVLADMDGGSVHCVVTSPPYWGLRSYGGDPDMIGLEPTFDAHLDNLLAVFREVRRVLRSDGTLWLNYGDAYAGSGSTGTKGGYLQGSARGGDKRRTPPVAGLKPKNLMMMPARVAMALQADGWWLRSEIVWHKPNPMPESVKDRPTSAHEKVFLLSKSRKYYYDNDAVRTPQPRSSLARYRYTLKGTAPTRHQPGQDAERAEREKGHFAPNPGGANLRNVWRITTKPFREAHFAVFPPELVEPCVKAGCPPGGTVLDPFGGAGTTGLVANRLGRNAVLLEISAEYAEMAARRISADNGGLPVTVLSR